MLVRLLAALHCLCFVAKARQPFNDCLGSVPKCLRQPDGRQFLLTTWGRQTRYVQLRALRYSSTAFNAAVVRSSLPRLNGFVQVPSGSATFASTSRWLGCAATGSSG